jgi:Flp pilus assembly protein TadD
VKTKRSGNGIVFVKRKHKQMNDKSVIVNEMAAGEVSLRQVLGVQKQEIEAIAAVGFQLYQQGRTADAQKIFDGLIALDNNIYYGYAGRGAMALVDEKLDDAVRWLTRAAELNPTDPAIHANLGEAFLRRGNFREASASFETAMKLDPAEKNPSANRARGILLSMQNMVEEHQRAQSAKVIN